MSKFSLRISSSRTDRVGYLLLDHQFTDRAVSDRNRQLIEAEALDIGVLYAESCSDSALEGMSALEEVGDWEAAEGHDWKIELHRVG